MRAFYQRNGLFKSVVRSATFFALAIRSLFYRLWGQDFVPSRYGVDMSANWDDATFNLCINATYGYSLSDLLLAENTEFTFWDIGSNQGLYSLVAAKNSQCKAVVAFEPVSQTFDLLRANVERNGFSEKVSLVNAAISSNRGSAEISLKDKHSGAASIRGVDDDLGVTEIIKTINAKDLDDFDVMDRKIIIKVDVEGHEQTVIEELVKSRHSDRIASIFYEIDERWADVDAIEQLLRTAKFSQFEKVGSGHHYDILASRPDI
ncbi:MAG: FkbM family methyltransferase [Pirellulaceae bacterium]|jgi:FkbM family methyltransferase